MTLTNIFANHVRRLAETTGQILQDLQLDSLVIDAGQAMTYFADDQHPFFRPTPHFAHWCPATGENHVLVISPGQKPRLFFYAPQDYWHERLPLREDFWTNAFDIEELSDPEVIWQRVKAIQGKNSAYIGPNTSRAEANHLAANPSKLTARLDWQRAYKTDYELHCMEQATAKAARGHKLAHEAFLAGASELEIHYAFLRGVGTIEQDLAYGTIVGLDEKAAILHYENKRPQSQGRVLLIDAGARHLGYCSDITRTYATAKASESFRALLTGMEKLQLELCAEARPGQPYPDYHHTAHLKIAALLQEVGIIRSQSASDTVSRGLTRVFFPHGLGHLLGIQVHDIGGHQINPDGQKGIAPKEHPYLRTLRPLDARQVITVEPGLYFIPMLLEPQRSGPHKDSFNWPLIDQLIPEGGIRIEDNIMIAEGGNYNLTRQYLP